MFRVIEKPLSTLISASCPKTMVGEIIRISIPRDRRTSVNNWPNSVKEKVEETAKVGVRNARRDGIDALKKAVKTGLAEDEQKNAEAKLQKITR
ncbi:ribosome recycling factor [Bacteroides ovatus]|nr:ribosome recycling factor [Bacteroides ovatus]